MISIKHSFHKSNFARLGETPEKDWRLALVCFTAGLFLVVAIDGLLFMSLSKDKELAATGGSSVTLEKSELIDAVKTIRRADSEAGAVPSSVRANPAR